MPAAEILELILPPLEASGLDYAITGSMASIAYGEPRLTHDLDLVLLLPLGALDRFLRAFPEAEFYRPPRETLLVEARRETRGHFNLIHMATGAKADCYLASHDPLHQLALTKRRRLPVAPGVEAWFAPPEYVILRELEFYREGQAQKHLADIAGMLRVSGEMIDCGFVATTARQRGLDAEWAAAQLAGG